MRRRNDGAAVAMTAMLVSGMLLLSACGSADAVKTDAIGATEEMAQTGAGGSLRCDLLRLGWQDRAADGGGRKRGMRQRVYAREGRKHFCRLVCLTPQMSHKFDFSQAVTEDTSVFAGFCDVCGGYQRVCDCGKRHVAGTSGIKLGSSHRGCAEDDEGGERQRECVYDHARFKRGRPVPVCHGFLLGRSARLRVSRYELNWTAWIILKIPEALATPA